MYSVKEIFYTLQGEGANAGRPAVFLRFAGCNLWSGREKDRATAVCKFCDTDFRGGEVYKDAERLAHAVEYHWREMGLNAGTGRCLQNRFVVITGGEPALQFDEPLKRALRDRLFFTAIETNGTVPLKAHPDWITVSPKTKDLKVTDGDELKLVYPSLPPELFTELKFRMFYLQPKAERWG